MVPSERLKTHQVRKELNLETSRQKTSILRKEWNNRTSIRKTQYKNKVLGKNGTEK